MQNEYGLDPNTGLVSDLSKLKHLDDARRQTASLIRDTINHYIATSPTGGIFEAMNRIIREQAFTILNRLCAMRMAEARGILVESIVNGYNSKGFNYIHVYREQLLEKRVMPTKVLYIVYLMSSRMTCLSFLIDTLQWDAFPSENQRS